MTGNGSGHAMATPAGDVFVIMHRPAGRESQELECGSNICNAMRAFSPVEEVEAQLLLSSAKGIISIWPSKGGCAEYMFEDQ